MRIYIASRYTAPTQEEMLDNAMVQVETAIKLMLLNHTPFAPLLSHWIDIRAKELNIEFTYDTWIEYCLTWLSQCDGLLYLGSSKGADIEKKFAEDHGIKVYFDIKEIENETNY